MKHSMAGRPSPSRTVWVSSMVSVVALRKCLAIVCASTTSNAGVPESKEFSFIDASEQVDGNGRCRSVRKS